MITKRQLKFFKIRNVEGGRPSNGKELCNMDSDFKAGSLSRIL